MTVSDLALVLSGGGARAAYQVGVLSGLADRRPGLAIPLITGVSAGAINAAYLAGHRGSLRTAADGLVSQWTRLTADHVYRLQPARTVGWLLSTLAGILSRRRNGAPVLRGLFDMGPLTRFLAEAIDFAGIEHNIQDGRLRAVALSATAYGSGRTETFLSGEPGVPVWERADGRALRARLTVSHVMASAALPLVFPAVKLDGEFYGDGSVRQTAPLAPAIHVGARRILAIAMRATRHEAKPVPPRSDYPATAQVLALLFHSVFLDALDADAERLELVNRLLADVSGNARSSGSPCHVDLLMLRPSRDLATLCTRCRPHLPAPLEWLVRAIGGERSADFLSYLMFDPAYTGLLIELGYHDVAAQWPRIERFLAAEGSSRCAA